jgi:hypothetical protein
MQRSIFQKSLFNNMHHNTSYQCNERKFTNDTGPAINMAKRILSVEQRLIVTHPIDPRLLHIIGKKTRTLSA